MHVQDIVGVGVHVAHCGFIDTRRGTVHPSAEVMEVACEKSAADEAKQLHKQPTAMSQDLRAKQSIERELAKYTRINKTASVRCAQLTGHDPRMLTSRLRSLKTRCALVKISTLI